MTKTNRPNVATVANLASSTCDAYSFGYYGPKQWVASAEMLLARGYNPVEAMAILRSVLTRLAHDGRRGRKATSADLARFLDENSGGPTELRELVDELVVNINTEDLIEAQQAANLASVSALRLVWSRPNA